jgi:primosomal protein N' (replication factor Y)
MYYSITFPTKNKLLGSDQFIYSSTKVFSVGDLVSCPFGRSEELGIITAKNVSAPKFKTREIIDLKLSDSLPQTSLKLSHWISEYYCTDPGLSLNLFCSKNLFTRILTKPAPEYDPEVTEPVKLNAHSAAQNLALNKINSDPKSRSFILHGETGSGKTEIYLHTALQTLKESKSVIILVPEIGLTPQNSTRFQELGFPLFTIHSNQTELSRAKSWQAVNNLTTQNKPVIILGPRSALFYPVRNIGLIIVDEFHDQAYKQDSSPKYYTPLVAAKLASLTESKLILGSASPNINEYYQFEKLSLPIIDLPSRSSQKKTVQIIDIRDRDQFTKSKLISTSLLTAIAQQLSTGNQSLIFHNKRGTSRLQSCSSCDWINLCPNCFIPLVFHGDSFLLRCHSCGFKTKPELLCPGCHSATLSLKGFGTKKIVDELQKLFPEARIARFDTDNTTKATQIEQNYSQIKDGQFNILVGTQMLAKGLDLPKLGLVGVIQAEGGLCLPDLYSSERTFQLLLQVIGRVGRGHQDGQIIIQTSTPTHPSIQYAANNSYSDFYQSELKARELGLDPPFRYLLKVSFKYSSERDALSAGKLFIAKLNTNPDLKGLHISGPAPAFKERSGKKYQFQILIKSASRTKLQHIVNSYLPTTWNFDLDPLSTL